MEIRVDLRRGTGAEKGQQVAAIRVRVNLILTLGRSLSDEKRDAMIAGDDEEEEQNERKEEIHKSVLVQDRRNISRASAHAPSYVVVDHLQTLKEFMPGEAVLKPWKVLHSYVYITFTSSLCFAQQTATVIVILQTSSSTAQNVSNLWKSRQVHL